MAHLSQTRTLINRLDAYKVPRHPLLDRIFDAADTVQTWAPEVPASYADLSAEQLDRLMVSAAVAYDPQLRDHALTRIYGELEAEGQGYLLEHVPAIVAHLRPAFAAAAKEVAKAAAIGLRPGMTADDVIDLDSPDAITAWRGLRAHLNTLSDIGRMRIELSQMLELSPQITLSQIRIGGTVDYTACFVHPSTKLTSGYSETSPWRWLSLAIATGGKLRLNDPDETLAILTGDGVSPGWVVCAAGCVITDDDGRQLQLYTHDWLPTWLDEEQRDRLIDDGLAVAADPSMTAPADKFPLGSPKNPTRQRKVLA